VRVEEGLRTELLALGEAIVVIAMAKRLGGWLYNIIPRLEAGVLETGSGEAWVGSRGHFLERGPHVTDATRRSHCTRLPFCSTTRRSIDFSKSYNTTNQRDHGR
jgi:hypothetical protein